MTHHSRRDFMRLACCSAATASLVGGLSKFGLVSALAQSTTDYKALVCIFLFGGNDANNLIVPVDTNYANYASIRANLAIPQASLLPLQIGSAANFGFHPNLPELQGLFNNQKVVAVLNNVGTLVQPTTQQQYQHQGDVPENLFSHSDQQNQWQTTQLSGIQNAGWAGKIADNLQPTYNVSANFPPILSVAGSTIFGTGIQSRPFTMNPGSTPGLSGIDSSAAGQAKFLGLQQLLDAGYGNFDRAGNERGDRAGDHTKFDAGDRAAGAGAAANSFPDGQQPGDATETSGAGDCGAQRAGRAAGRFSFARKADTTRTAISSIRKSDSTASSARRWARFIRRRRN